MFADEIRRAIEASSRITLPAVTALLWRAYGEGKVSEAEAETLSGLIEARQVSAPRQGESAGSASIEPSNRFERFSDGIEPKHSENEREIGVTGLPARRPGGLRTSAGSRPRTDASMERRRRWAASGRLPPALAAKFTPGEQAALSLVAAETARRGDCRLAIEHMAALAGVSRSTVKAAIREAKKLGLLTVEERRITGFRNDTNVVRIISPEWTAWLRLARKGVTVRAPLGRKGEPSRDPLGSKGMVKHHPLPVGDGLSLRRERKGGGVKSSTGTPTQVSTQGKTRTIDPSRRSLAPLDPSSREASRSAGARPRRCAGEGSAPGPR